MYIFSQIFSDGLYYNSIVVRFTLFESRDRQILIIVFLNDLFLEFGFA